MTNVHLSESASRRAALRRLSAFVPSSGRAYAASRNSDLGPEDRSNVSMLSPYIRHRLLLEEEVLDAVLARFAPPTAEKFIQEVFWRTYFKGWLEQRPSVWTAYRRDVDQLMADISDGLPLAGRYHEATQGRTGIACFDAWVSELVTTGYLHNHARMWFASIWIFTLKLPWQLGADFFYRHLSDGDPASNTLSWRWVAGLHTKGKSYLARADNIRRFTNGRFNPVEQLAKSAPPLEERETHALRPLPAAAKHYDGAPAIVLITEEDCFLESLVDRDGIRGCVACLATTGRSPMPIGNVARRVAETALEDALERAAAHFNCPIARCHDAQEWAGVIKQICTEANVATVVTAYSPVGPVADALARCRHILAEADIRLVKVRRAFDDLVWPHATKGFFALKAKIPTILEQRQRQMELPI